MDFAVIVPAYNEGRTIAKVLEPILQAKQEDNRIKQVIVVDDGSSDNTAQVAASFGVTLIRFSQNRGKGAAMTAGVAASDYPGLLFLDADLLGLTSAQVRSLIDPLVSGKARMTLGIFESGRMATDLAQAVAPDITGQRAMRKDDFLLVRGLEKSRYGVDIALTNYAQKMAWKIKKVPIKGVTQVMKEEKYGLVRGARARFRMYLDILRNFKA